MAEVASKSFSKFLILCIIGLILIVPVVFQLVHTTIRDRHTQSFTLRRQLDMSRLPKEQRVKFVDTTLLYVVDPNEEGIQVEWQVTDNLVQVSGIADRLTIQRLDACLKVIELQLPALHMQNRYLRRQNSDNKLRYLSQMLEKYAKGHDGTFPDYLSDLGVYDSEGHLDWLIEHCEYLGRGKGLRDSFRTLIAYDGSLLEDGRGTMVLFLDSLTEYAEPEKLKALGILTEP